MVSLVVKIVIFYFVYKFNIVITFPVFIFHSSIKNASGDNERFHFDKIQFLEMMTNSQFLLLVLLFNFRSQRANYDFIVKNTIIV